MLLISDGQRRTQTDRQISSHWHRHTHFVRVTSDRPHTRRDTTVYSADRPTDTRHPSQWRDINRQLTMNGTKRRANHWYATIIAGNTGVSEWRVWMIWSRQTAVTLLVNCSSCSGGGGDSVCSSCCVTSSHSYHGCWRRRPSLHGRQQQVHLINTIIQFNQS